MLRRRYRRRIARRSRYSRRGPVMRRRRFIRRRGWRSRRRGFTAARVTKFGKALLPEALYTNLTYKTVGYIGHGNGTYSDAVVVYRLNSPWDPKSGTNEAAQGFLYWNEFYTQYITTSSVAVMTFTNVADYPVGVWMLPQLGSAGPSYSNATFEVLSNWPGVRYAILAPKGAPGSRKTLKVYWSIKKDQGISNRASAWEGSNYSAAVNADPVANRYIYHGTFNPTSAVWASTVSQDVQLSLYIKYKTKFFGRAQSPMVQ